MQKNIGNVFSFEKEKLESFIFKTDEMLRHRHTLYRHPTVSAHLRQ
jgi:hypothetical protein